MLIRMLNPETDQNIIVAEGQHDRGRAAPLKLSHQILPTGEAVAYISGELDIATADSAVRYVTRVIDRHHGPVILDLAALSFCDARGLSSLLRMARYAEQSDRNFFVASPTPWLVKLLRITALDHRLLGATPGFEEKVLQPTSPCLQFIAGALSGAAKLDELVPVSGSSMASRPASTPLPTTSKQ